MIRAFTLMLLLAGCMNNSPTSLFDARVEVTTDKDEYAIGDSVLVTIRNNSDRSIFLHHCDWRLSMLIERRIGSEWVEEMGIRGPICPAILPSGRVAVASGGSESESVVVEQAGDYRLRMKAEAEDPAAGVLSLASNTFRVVD